MAASHEGLDDRRQAIEWGEKAHKDHSKLVDRSDAASDPDFLRQAKRELAQSAVFTGQLILSTCVEIERQDHFSTIVPDTYKRKSLKRLRDAWSALEGIEGDGPVDQYRINAASRLAVAEALYGDTKTGRKVARQSLGLALQSESPKLPTSAELPRRDRYRAVARALVRGAVANVVSVLATEEDTSRRFIAVRVAPYAI